MLIYLLTLVDEDNRKTVEKLYNKFHSFMVASARSVMKRFDHDNFTLDCEDAVQNAFVKIIQYGKINLDRSDREIRAYMYTVVVNECYEIMKRRKKWRELEENIEYSEEEAFFEQINVAEEYDTIVRVISELDPIYSTTLRLCLVEEMKPAEVAKMMGVSVNTVNTRLRRGKQKVIEVLRGDKDDK